MTLGFPMELCQDLARFLLHRSCQRNGLDPRQIGTSVRSESLCQSEKQRRLARVPITSALQSRALGSSVWERLAECAREAVMLFVAPTVDIPKDDGKRGVVSPFFFASVSHEVSEANMEMQHPDPGNYQGGRLDRLHIRMPLMRNKHAAKAKNILLRSKSEKAVA